MSTLTAGALAELLDLLHSQSPKDTLERSLSDWMSRSADMADSKPITWTVEYLKLKARAHPYLTTLFLLVSIRNNSLALRAGPGDSWLHNELKARQKQPAFTDAWQDMLHILRSAGPADVYEASCIADYIRAGVDEPTFEPSSELQVLVHGGADVRSLLATSESLGFPWHTVWTDWRVKIEAAQLPEALAQP